MSWKILIHPLVVKEGLPALDIGAQRNVLKAIRKKLGTAPDTFGSPLRGEFAGYWKMRVGDYRVIYTFRKEHILVKVIKVGARRNFEVYDALIKRIPKILDF